MVKEQKHSLEKVKHLERQYGINDSFDLKYHLFYVEQLVIDRVSKYEITYHIRSYPKIYTLHVKSIKHQMLS